MKLEIAFRNGNMEKKQFKDENEARDYLKSIGTESIIYFDVLDDNDNFNFDSPLLNESYPRPAEDIIEWQIN